MCKKRDEGDGIEDRELRELFLIEFGVYPWEQVAWWQIFQRGYHLGLLGREE